MHNPENFNTVGVGAIEDQPPIDLPEANAVGLAFRPTMASPGRTANPGKLAPELPQ